MLKNTLNLFIKIDAPAGRACIITEIDLDVEQAFRPMVFMDCHI
jgi:hypothetical protein